MQNHNRLTLMDAAFIFGSMPGWLEIGVVQFQDFFIQALKAIGITIITFYVGRALKKKNNV